MGDETSMRGRSSRVYGVGAGPTDFVEPSSRADWDYPERIREAVQATLADARRAAS